MLASILRIILFVAIVGLAIWGLTWLIETPGQVVISFAGEERVLAPITALGLMLLAFVGLWLAIRILGLLLAVFQFLTGDETAFTRHMDRSRERRGMDALSQGMTALAAGDGRTALARAQKAEKLVRRPELTRLLTAQAAELAGDEMRATATYREMAEVAPTALAGTKGLLKIALRRGETERALNLAQHAFLLSQSDPFVLDTLGDLQNRTEDWAGARKTVATQRKLGLLPRAEADRRESALALALASEAEAVGETEEARKLAVEAARLDPANTEAVIVAARLLVAAGAGRTASKHITEAWRARPDPRLGAAFAEIEPEESIENRIRRFQKLFSANPDHAETHFLKAELALAAGDWESARAALAAIGEDEPSARSCAILAAVARGEGAPEAVVRGWLARALGAPRDAGIESQLGNAAMLPLLIEGAPAERARPLLDAAESPAEDAAIAPPEATDSPPSQRETAGSDLDTSPHTEDAQTSDPYKDAELATEDHEPATPPRSQQSG